MGAGDRWRWRSQLPFHFQRFIFKDFIVKDFILKDFIFKDFIFKDFIFKDFILQRFSLGKFSKILFSKDFLYQFSYGHQQQMALTAPTAILFSKILSKLQSYYFNHPITLGQ